MKFLSRQIAHFSSVVFKLCSQRKMASEPSTNVVAKLDKALINANSGDDKNETALLMMSPSVNWAEFLTPAPLSIALLGQLMLVAGEKDFSLENQRPEKGFQFIQHPESFRACLVQVSNTGWRAFNEAHKVRNLSLKNISFTFCSLKNWNLNR